MSPPSASPEQQASEVPEHSKRREMSEGLGDEALGVAAGALARWRGPAGAVTVVAVDGHGASGKSTIAGQLCSLSGATVVHTDDFFLPLSLSSPERMQRLEGYYDLARLRAEALEPLKDGREAVFRAYNWESGTLSPRTKRVCPEGLVVLEGVCSSSPELSDLVDKTVYVHTPESERLGRLRARVAPQEWDSDWLRAEKEYFTRVRPLQSFDLVIRGSRTTPLVRREARVPDEGGRAGISSKKRDRR